MPADTLLQAVSTAMAVIEQAGDAGVVALEVMSTAEFDARLGFAPVPDLVSVSEAAELLAVTRQRILQMLAERKLSGTRIGKSNVIPRTAVSRSRPGSAPTPTLSTDCRRTVLKSRAESASNRSMHHRGPQMSKQRLRERVWGTMNCGRRPGLAGASGRR